jgi:rhodanese-related sulfurtransferase
VPEVVDAFSNKSDEDFKDKYGFPKPDKIADEVVVGCQAGICAGNFAEYLKQIGFTKVRYLLIFHPKQIVISISINII